MKQIDRIAKLEKEVDYLKDYVSNLHRTFAALVSEGKLQASAPAKDAKPTEAEPEKKESEEEKLPVVTHKSSSTINRRTIM